MITSNLSNVTNKMVSKYTFGVNWYKDGYDTGVYTACRAGGEGQTRYNYANGAYNAGRDWYFIQEKENTWQDLDDAANADGQVIITQISAMGWVAKGANKIWSFSQTKYGAQQSNEWYICVSIF